MAVKIHDRLSHALMAGVEYIIITVSLIGDSLAVFVAPIGINRLLKSVIIIYGSDFLFIIFQSPGNRRCRYFYSAMVLDLFALCWANRQKYLLAVVYFYCNEDNSSYRTEGLLTQLVFEHSLRIRLKAEASNEKIEEDNLAVIVTEDDVSVTKGTFVDSNPGERASQSSQASTPISRNFSSDSRSTSNGPVKGKDSSTLKNDTKSATKDKKKNLIGKINNLVTTDLGNIIDGREFILISTLQFF